MSGQPLALEIPDLLATNGSIHDALRDLLSAPIQ
jgi:hypothetical protein